MEKEVFKRKTLKIHQKIRDKILSVFKHDLGLSTKEEDFSLSPATKEPFFWLITKKGEPLSSFEKALFDNFGDKIQTKSYSANKKRLDVDITETLVEEFGKEENDSETGSINEAVNDADLAVPNLDMPNAGDKTFFVEEKSFKNVHKITTEKNEAVSRNNVTITENGKFKDPADIFFVNLQINLGVYDERMELTTKSHKVKYFEISVSEKLIERVKDYLKREEIGYEYNDGRFKIVYPVNNIGTENQPKKEVGKKKKSINKKKLTVMKNVKVENRPQKALIKLCRKDRLTIYNELSRENLPSQIRKGINRRDGVYYVKSNVKTVARSLFWEILVLENENRTENLGKIFNIIKEHYKHHKKGELVEVVKSDSDFTITIKYIPAFFDINMLSDTGSKKEKKNDPVIVLGEKTNEIFQNETHKPNFSNKELLNAVKIMVIDELWPKLEKENVLYVKYTCGDDGKPKTVSTLSLDEVKAIATS